MGKVHLSEQSSKTEDFLRDALPISERATFR
jgi:hypothetical protein